MGVARRNAAASARVERALGATRASNHGGSPAYRESELKRYPDQPLAITVWNRVGALAPAGALDSARSFVPRETGSDPIQERAESVSGSTPCR